MSHDIESYQFSRHTMNLVAPVIWTKLGIAARMRKLISSVNFFIKDKIKRENCFSVALF